MIEIGDSSLSKGEHALAGVSKPVDASVEGAVLVLSNSGGSYLCKATRLEWYKEKWFKYQKS